MKKYAQIKDSKVHWIFEHKAQNLDELYSKYFCKNDVEIIDITDLENVTEGMDAKLVNGEYVFTEHVPDAAEIQAQAEVEASAIITRAAKKQAAETAELTDSEIAIVGKAGYLDEWAPDMDYKTGKRLTFKDMVYILMQDVRSQAHQPPDAAGMLAIYRPASVDASGNEPDGTLDNPIPLIMGMDTIKDKHYLWQGQVYLALQDAKPCIWEPQTVPALFEAVYK